jgi:hypothetical protein
VVVVVVVVVVMTRLAQNRALGIIIDPVSCMCVCVLRKGGTIKNEETRQKVVISSFPFPLGGACLAYFERPSTLFRHFEGDGVVEGSRSGERVSRGHALSSSSSLDIIK